MNFQDPKKPLLLEGKHSCLLGTGRVTTSAKIPVVCATGNVPSMSTGSSSHHDLASYWFLLQNYSSYWDFLKEKSRSICCRKELESSFPLAVNQMNNHSKEKFHSHYWTFCNHHDKHSFRGPLHLQIPHRSITNVVQNTLKINLHCQVIEFCASGMLLAWPFFPQ